MIVLFEIMEGADEEPLVQAVVSGCLELTCCGALVQILF